MKFNDNLSCIWLSRVWVICTRLRRTRYMMRKKRMSFPHPNYISSTKPTKNNLSKLQTPTLNTNFQLILIFKTSQFLAADPNSNLSPISSPSPTDPHYPPLETNPTNLNQCIISKTNRSNSTIHLTPLKTLKIPHLAKTLINLTQNLDNLAKTLKFFRIASTPQRIRTRAYKKWNSSLSVITCSNFGRVNWKKSWETHEFFYWSVVLWAFPNWIVQELLINCIFIFFNVSYLSIKRWFCPI